MRATDRKTIWAYQRQNVIRHSCRGNITPNRKFADGSRLSRAGVRGKPVNALAGAHDAAVQMIDTSIVRVLSTVPASLGTEDSRWAGHTAV